jgi:DMSO/TMAO reductase YedYZ heme-binding membrane subunit
MDPKLWWYLARTTGIVTWGLATTSVLVGLALSSRALGRKPTAPWLLDLHRFLGGLAVVMLAGHLGALWADSYSHIALREMLIPMASTFRPGAVTWGVVAMYALVAVEASSLAIRRLPRSVWRSIHTVSFVSFGAGTVHLWQAGSDSGNSLLRWVVAGAVFAVVVLTGLRVKNVMDQRDRREQRGLALEAARTGSR